MHEENLWTIFTADYHILHGLLHEHFRRVLKVIWEWGRACNKCKAFSLPPTLSSGNSGLDMVQKSFDNCDGWILLDEQKVWNNFNRHHLLFLMHQFSLSSKSKTVLQSSGPVQRPSKASFPASNTSYRKPLDEKEERFQQPWRIGLNEESHQFSTSVLDLKEEAVLLHRCAYYFWVNVIGTGLTFSGPSWVQPWWCS